MPIRVKDMMNDIVRAAVDYNSSDDKYDLRVKVKNTDQNPVPVILSSGSILYEYEEVNSVGLGDITILSLTASGNDLKLLLLEFSGDNLGHFRVVKNNVDVIAKKRNWWADFNGTIDLKSMVLSDGDNVKIIVENKTNSAAAFNATLFYSEITG